jgi:hypothetical protein
MPSGHHAVGWSVFGLAIIAVAGALSVNHVLLAGVETIRSQQIQAVQAISAVRQRTQQWPASDHDPMLSSADRAKLRAVKATFRLDQIAGNGRHAFYFVKFGGRALRLDVPA